MNIVAVLLDPSFLTILVLSLLTGFFCGLVFFHTFDSRVFDERGRLIPGPKHHLWGKNFFSIARLIYYTHQYSKTIYEKFLREVGNGDIVAYNWINGKPTIIVAHPDMAKTVLSGHHLKFLKDDSWDRVKNILGCSLATCHEKIWQKYRNILTPLFRSSNLRDMVTTFNLHGRRLLRHWQFRLQQQLQEKGNEAIRRQDLFIKSHIDKEFRHLVLGIMCECTFGYDFLTRSNSELFSQDFEILLNEFAYQMSDDPLETLTKGKISFTKRKSKRDTKTVQIALSNIQQLLENTITHRLDGTLMDDEMYPGFSKDDSSSRTNSPSKPNSAQRSLDLAAPNDLLQLLLYANEETVDNQRLTIEEIRDHILSFMILGYENTVASLMWVLYELCLHPDIQKKCQMEIDDILTVQGVKTTAVTYEDIPKFSRLIQILKETLRLHPPVATLSRKCTTACTIGDYSIKAGSRISMSILALHRHPSYWYLPNDFFPERFSPENIAETIKHPFQYIPFGAGGRNCLGQRFSQITIVVVLAVLLSKFQFSLDEEDKKEIRFEEKASYCPVNLRVVIEDREQQGNSFINVASIATTTRENLF